MPHILITSAGRRVELVQAFKEQAATLMPQTRVHANDLEPSLSAACQIADACTPSRRVTDAGYVEELLDYCLANGIKLVVPTIDTELAVLATARPHFAKHGIAIVVSSSDLVGMCRDKRLTGELFNSFGIRYPEMFAMDAIKFPCFVKPFDGSSSIGAQLIRNASDLTDDVIKNPRMMYMEFIDSSYAEYTVDAYYDQSGNLQCMVPRHRLQVRTGEVSKGVTRRSGLYRHLITRLAHVPGAVGCLTIQMFVNEEKSDYVGLEVNPRFGGGFPLSDAAGANYPGWLIKEYLLGEKVDFYDAWTADLMMLRYDAKVLVRNA
jgi:carbamoyl-phosphate synthase large subunit